MTWVKVEDTFPDHPKVLGLSGDAIALHLFALCYCSRHLTDGHLPAGALLRLGISQAPKRAKELNASGLWERSDDGWVIHDYLDYQRSAEQVTAEREAARQRQSRRRSQGESRRDKAVTNGVSSEEVREPEVEVETEEENPPIGPPERRKPETTWPQGFVLTEPLLAYAADKAPSIDPEREFERAENWAVSNDARKRDWSRFMQNWFLKAEERAPKTESGFAPVQRFTS